MTTRTHPGLAAAALAVVALPISTVAARPDVAPAVRQQLARLADMDPGAMVVLERRVVVERVGEGRRLRSFTVFDPRARRMRRITLHQGDPVSLREVRRRERAAALEATDGLPPVLFRRVRMIEQGGNPDTELLRVTVMVAVPNVPSPAPRPARVARPPVPPDVVAGPDVDPDDDATAKSRADVARRAEAIFAAVTDGLTARTETVSGPFVRARIAVSDIRRVAADDRVLAIGLNEEEVPDDGVPLGDVIGRISADLVQKELAVTGAGTRVAIQDMYGVTDTWRTCLGLADSDVQKDLEVAEDGDGLTHTVLAAGLIRNRFDAGDCKGAFFGYAPDATVLVANGDGYEDRTEWCIGQKARVFAAVTQLSGEGTVDTPSIRDVYFDYVAANPPYPTIFVSGGNSGSSRSPIGRGYNALGVANVLVDETPERCDDLIGSSTNSLQPGLETSDRRLPELSAPGSRQALLGSDFGQTSAAAPVAASVAALLISHDGTLAWWPEAVRAILHAAADDLLTVGESFIDASEQGFHRAGYIDALAALRCAEELGGTGALAHGHAAAEITSDDFTGGLLDGGWEIAYGGAGGDRIRVALAWSSTATTETSSELTANLDLVVLDEAGAVAATSGSEHNSYEIAEFRPEGPGTFTILVADDPEEPGWAPFKTGIGLAWSTDTAPCDEIPVKEEVSLDLDFDQRELRDYLDGVVAGPVAGTVVLDHYPLALAFVEGRYEVFELRDRRTGRSGVVVVDLDRGRIVDRGRLRERDRVAAATRATRLAPELIERLLLDPDLPAVRVRIDLVPATLGMDPAAPAAAWEADALRARVRDELAAGRPGRPASLAFDGPSVVTTLPARDVVALNDSPVVRWIRLSGAAPERPARP
ncbi:MAG: S8 family serine peptidase [Planctomycetota bacterium]|jgi:hypothetical protein